jgi:PPOX class probable F420-dependent enzyme
MAVTFNEETRRLVDGRNFATIATIDPDGSPHASIVWVMSDGDSVLFSTTRDRRKGRNLARDPRVSLSIFDRDDPYRYVEIRGTVELTVDEGKALPPELGLKYGRTSPPEAEDVVRLIVRVIPEKISGTVA